LRCSRRKTRVYELISLYLAFKGVDGQTRFDLSRINWLFPLLILPVAAYIQDTDSDFICPGDPSIRSYLETVRFPSGVESVSEVQKEKSYVPLIALRKSRFQEREGLRDCFAEIVYRVLKPTAGVKNAVYYPITELVENIFEHSCEEKGYVFAQHYPKKDLLISALQTGEEE